MTSIILKISDLKKSFTRNTLNIQGESQNERFNIIDNLDLIVTRNTITALIGGNGAGKTTLFNIISRFIEPDSGSIIFYNEKEIDLLRSKPYQIYRHGIGRLFQDNHIFLDMTVAENMLISSEDNYAELPFISLFRPKLAKLRDIKRLSKMHQIFTNLFGTDSEFHKKINDYAGSLSYGQQRLLGIARLFMTEYRLILLDEPTAGVNPAVISKISSIIKKMPSYGITVILIEHNMKVVEETAEFCCFLDNGTIKAIGTPTDIIGNPEVRKIYMGI